MIEEIAFEGRRGLQLRGSLHIPDGRVRGSVVVCHGMLSFRGSEKHVAVCEALADAAFASLRFDFAGRGDSEGRESDLTVTGEVADLEAALALVRDRFGGRTTLVGSSLGGTVALLAASRDSRISRLVTVAAPAVLPSRPRAAWDVGSQTFDAFFADAKRHDVRSAAAAVSCPWLVIHGEDDAVVPPRDADLIAKAGVMVQLVKKAGADHRFADPACRKWLVETIADWIAGPW